MQGIVPIPQIVQGVPHDILMQQQMVQAAAQAHVDAGSPQPGGGAPPAPGTLSSPSPMSSPIMTEASKLQAPQLGTQGNVERAALAAETQQS